MNDHNVIRDLWFWVEKYFEHVQKIKITRSLSFKLLDILRGKNIYLNTRQYFVHAQKTKITRNVICRILKI